MSDSSLLKFLKAAQVLSHTICKNTVCKYIGFYFTQIAGGLGAVLMATTHAIFHMPAGVIGIVFYQVLSEQERLGAYLLPLWTIFLLSMSVSLFGSLADFFIYLYTFAAFSESASRLFSKCCGCYTFTQCHGSGNGSKTGNTRWSTNEEKKQELCNNNREQEKETLTE